MRLFISLAATFVATCIAGPAWASALNATPEQLAAGRKIYNFRCYFCHGYSGNAQTVAASMLSPPPVDFTRADPAQFTPEHIISVLRDGKPGTAMKSFRTVISDTGMAQVAAFVVDEFVRRKAPNTRYHTVENGWPGHERFIDAFPFATGEIPASVPWEALTEAQAKGKKLFLSACISCHDRGTSGGDATAWEARPLSYPRNEYSPGATPEIDAMASASPYRLHDIPPQVSSLSEQEARGEKLFQANCAFCHAADGTGKNWIGSFLEPHPRNLRDPAFMAGMTRARLATTIREGLPDTSMPAWKSVLSEGEIAAIVSYVAKAMHPLKD